MDRFDVVVLGTGAAGLTAAISAHEAGASVGIFEKAETVGGTTSVSGGVAWVPANRQAAEAGIEDSPELALEYLMSLSHDQIDESLAGAFAESAPEVFAWLEAETPVEYLLFTGFPDYHAEQPGGLPGGGRSLQPTLFSFQELGDWAQRVSGPLAPRRLIEETPIKGGIWADIPPEETKRREEKDLRGGGQALVGALLRGCLDRGIEPVTNARGRRLAIEDGRVAGVSFEATDGAAREVRAEAVIVATGGFEWDEQLVRTFLRGPMTAPLSIPTNTGDGLRMMMRAGAALGNMKEAWWIPATRIPGIELLGRETGYLLVGERSLPGSLMVNRQAVRFTNEAANYNALGGAFHQLDAREFDFSNLPAWLIFDESYLRKYGFATVMKDDPAPDWLTSAETIGELAENIGLPAAQLEQTVEKFNGYARDGHDPDFHRGDRAHDNWHADHSREGAQRSLGPLEHPPYYAVEVEQGTLGTKGGGRTDAEAQVQDLDGEPIPGLYAAGNAMAVVTGMVYGGAGGTLGPGITFGFRAGRAAANSALSPKLGRATH
jgi:3-oxosteroid 1-dehydrogenase